MVLSLARRTAAATAAQWLAVVAGAVSYLALAGYVLDSRFLHPFAPFASLALPTAAGLAALSLGMLFAGPNGALLALAADPGAGGLLVRHLVPCALILPAALGWLQLKGRQAGYYDERLGIMLAVLCTGILLGTLIWFTARPLRQADRLRQAAEDRRRDAESKYRSTLDHLIEGCQIIGPDWRYLYVNEAAGTHGRAPASELVGRTMMEAYPGIDATPLFATLRRCMQDGESQRVQNEFTYPDGNTAWFELSIQPVPEGLFILSIDVTERRRAEQAFRDHQKLLQTVIDLVPHFIYAKDRSSRHLFANRACAAANGLQPEQMVGLNDHDFVTNRDEAETFMRDDRQVIERGEPRENIEERLTDRNGLQRVLLTTKIPFTPPGSSEAALLGVSVDITELKRAEEEVRRLNAELEARVRTRTAALESANQELEAFSYSVSHDLRAPLRHVGGFADLLSRRAGASLDEESRRLLGKITEAASHMATMIDELLVFSRTARAELHPRPVDLTELTRETIAALLGGSEPRHITWEVDELPTVEGDPTLLRLVLQNLLENAIKYTRPRDPAVITIQGTLTGSEVIVRVRDNGVGFDPRYQDKLFGVFQRLHRIEEFEGTGIGLASVRRIIQRHGGRTWAEGEVGRGATFSFSLPLRPVQGGGE